MDDWGMVTVFGRRPAVAPRVRPSAYGIIADERGELAIVRSAEGTFLPGGGIETGETPQQAIVREALEECGFVVRLGAWTLRAVQFSYSVAESTYLEKRSTFIDCAVEAAGAASEAGHELIWADFETATRLLSHRSHVWAVAKWQSRSRQR